MQTDPMEEWRRLSALYGEMGDVEIRELAAQIGDLTQTAQQVLQDEMKKRRLDEEANPSKSSRQIRDSQLDVDGYQPMVDDADEQPDGGKSDSAVGYSWKTPVCECETGEEAWQRSEMLRRAGIENWIEDPASRSRLGAWTIENPRVMVAADQLEQARGIVTQPVPQDILDLSNQPAEEFEFPVCPKCGAEDPTLESAEPSNNWLCESCGYAWSEAVVADGVADLNDEK